MKNKILLIGLLALTTGWYSCSGDDTPSGGGEPSDIVKQVSISASITYQTIEGFSASDCWSGNYVGRDWDTSAREGIARLLFSQTIQSGTPQGIGLSMWRFNLGGGSAEQGAASDIEDKARRAECFLNADGTLDWTRQAGQQFFLRKAKEYGCSQFVMFSNTPPVYYTYNGKGYSNLGSRSNLKGDCYDLFADYMTNVAAHFRQEGIPFTYISPVNEPQYNWDSPSQEGTAFQNTEISKLVKSLDASLKAKGEGARILLGEAGDWEYLYKSKSDAGRSNQIEAFFDPASANYIGNLTSLEPAISGHSYWTDGSWSTLYSVRKQVATAAVARGLKLHQTEWSMLGDGYSSPYPGHEQASFMDIALHMSKVIYHDLTAAQVSSWSYWTSMDVERWGHKNRFLLINLVPQDGPYGDIAKSGTYNATKTLWTLGNYSLFVRPGYQRIDLSVANPSESFFGSAYLSPSKDKLVMVYTNLTDKKIGVEASLNGLNKKVGTIKRYETSETKDLTEETLDSERYSLSPKSVTTIVYELK